ncbi:MAG: TetR/AcrR family transcriptional regulator [Intrasporangium sp.]|uniref:TetR family transcriptional regulator n=1 Tax=Intrasporangium sp. TaxID=1925024 RepID=UPI002647762B|nr:TetR family transcriptional regulator [Intrasporangium sp.]MDN5796633.1 TetR/AcrR family transcriptional regulator [Intrasporangium sp.]
MSTTGDDCGLRERKKRETLLAIHRAALDLVEEHGFDAVTTEQIADRAGVSPRTFFNYYPSKDGAVLGRRADDFEQLRTAMRDAPPDESPLEVVRRLVITYFSPATLDADLRAQRRRVLVGEPTLAPALVRNNIRLETVLTEALEERLGLAPGTALAPRVAVNAAIGAVRACIEYRQSGGAGTIEDLATDAIAMLVRGLDPLPLP